jgi:biopolymer transport protein TolQ
MMSVTHYLLLAQVRPGEALSAWSMITHGTLDTKIVLGVLAAFSLLSWGLILWKLRQFQRLRRQAREFLGHMQRGERLEESYRGVLSLPESPFTRVFRRGVNFFSELRPGALREGAVVAGLSPTQLEVLRLVLEKEEGEERDEMAHGLAWLAILATVSPLLGLLGTVLGVMNSFIGVATSGSSSITAIAPGVAEALVATVAGLVVAIPSAMAYNHFSSRLQLFMGQLEGFSSEFIGTLAREGKV